MGPGLFAPLSVPQERFTVGGSNAHGRRVLYVQYTNPGAYPPLCHSARILVAAGFDVAILGIAEDGEALHFPSDPRIAITLIPLQPPGWRQKLHYARFAMWACLWARRWKPSWVYVSDLLAAPIGLALHQMLGARTIYHEHDTPDAASSSIFVKAALAARRRLAAHADQCVLPNAERAQTFGRATGRCDAVTVWNCPMRAEVASRNGARGAVPMRVLYHGSIVPARLPVAVIEAVARVGASVSLTIVGYETIGHRGYVDRLKTLAQTLGIARNVNFAGSLSRSDLMVHCARFDVGLALLPSDGGFDEPNMVGASNKPFDYLACGLALLVSDLPDWRAAFVDTGFARSCDAASAESIAAALQWFVEHPAEREAMGARGRQKILEEWNYERAFAPVLQHMLANVR